MDNIELLNEWFTSPVVKAGKIVALQREDENEDVRELTKEECEKLGLDPQNLGCVEPHRDGVDRGYVPVLTSGEQYDENTLEWH